MSEVLTSPFIEKGSMESIQDEDMKLCTEAVNGDAAALTTLVRKHQRWVYNIALRLVLSPIDAEDLAQESWIRIVTRLSQFQGKSAFRTWAYRIVVNRFRDGKRKKLEQRITTFYNYGEELDSIPFETLNLPVELEPYQELVVEDAKVGCMLGMLLCLNREQRIVYVLGEIFEAPSAVAAEILEITPATFRKRLERARRDLTSFMNEKCGLLNEANPCRCNRKTQSFIQAGWVDPYNLKFTAHHVARLKQVAPKRSQALCELTEVQYGDLFREHPILDGPDIALRLRDLIRDQSLRCTFGLDEMS
ncbi:RNA polymerase sigma factor [Nodosilinea sp. LEGE 07298]|uniref:RNA polymerase sigma factor n=1 Tax=Nodosilinea sp. LEGE 07298 TaxID=2777970 RepID=UPI001880C293|nr:RNA polymerase sigma factor [Nodosilinea sp. LEGE 07298]MBE9109865.1 RNA polymerase sigma factor [Nodosilinea sp. LEGE 07298]